MLAQCRAWKSHVATQHCHPYALALCLPLVWLPSAAARLARTSSPSTTVHVASYTTAHHLCRNHRVHLALAHIMCLHVHVGSPQRAAPWLPYARGVVEGAARVAGWPTSVGQGYVGLVRQAVARWWPTVLAAAIYGAEVVALGFDMVLARASWLSTQL